MSWGAIFSVRGSWFGSLNFIIHIEEAYMKFISWNVNGIRACVQKGFLEFFKEADADIFCIQETKMQEGQLSLE